MSKATELLEKIRELKESVVKVRMIDDKIAVESPYNSDFVKKARQMQGKWDSKNKVWVFDNEDRSLVLDILRSVYGYEESGELVTVEVGGDALKSGDKYDHIVLFGQDLAKRWDRDSEVKLPKNVRVIKGDFASSGGSRKSPAIGDIVGVVLKVKDVSKMKAEELLNEYPKDVKIITKLAPIIKKNDLKKAGVWDDLIKEIKSLSDKYDIAFSGKITIGKIKPKYVIDQNTGNISFE